MPSNILTLGCALALRAAGAAAQDSELLPVGAMDGSWDGTSTYACNFEFGSRTEKQCQKEDLPPAGDRVTLQECEADCAPVPPPPPLQYNFSCYKFIATYACFKTGFQSGCQVVDPGTNKSTLGEEFATYAECTSAANDCKPDGAKPASEGEIQCKNLYGLSEDDKKHYRVEGTGHLSLDNCQAQLAIGKCDEHANGAAPTTNDEKGSTVKKVLIGGGAALGLVVVAGIGFVAMKKKNSHSTLNDPIVGPEFSENDTQGSF